VAELEEMVRYAKEKGVPVYMGYNKNVTPYVIKALEAQAKLGGSMTFIHNNAYKEEELPECFERNAEGMLKNMAIHELALLATCTRHTHTHTDTHTHELALLATCARARARTHTGSRHIHTGCARVCVCVLSRADYGVTVENIASVEPDAEYSRCLTLTGPGGSEFTDFAKVGFTVTTKDGKTVTVRADRCGCTEGGNSVASVAVDGEVKFSAKTPDEELKKLVDAQAKEDPEMMPYFFLQSDDYITLKERATAHILSGAPGAPEGMATIDVAVDALKVAEYLTPLLQDALK